MITDKQKALQALPAVDAVLALHATGELIEAHGRHEVVAAVREAVASSRDSIIVGEDAVTDAGAVLELARQILERAMAPNMKRVVNATGVVLHTGLGRAVMPEVAREALSGATGCCNVQMDLATGERVKREQVVRDLVVDLTGAEEVLVVGNNVGATLLVLRALSAGSEVIVSRGELIEIGGSFRLPDAMRESGAVLREVGTTNKTHLRDYENAIREETGMILKVHKSNYDIVGFTAEVGIGDLAPLGQAHNIPVVDDIGCGALLDLEQFGLEHEMTVRESLESGSDIVLFSTDKLIGGPQGGMIVGRKDLLDLIRKSPMYRAMRVCKLTLAALEATLRLFKAPEQLGEKHPVYSMITKTVPAMRKQARKLLRDLEPLRPDWELELIDGESRLGGGSLPSSSLPSVLVGIVSRGASAQDIASQLRTASVPVIPRIDNETVMLDMRTVSHSELSDVVAACSVGEAPA